MVFNLIIQSLKEFFVYLRNFDNSDLSSLTDKLYAAISEAKTDKTVQDIFKVLTGWLDVFNYYIGSGFWGLLIRIFKAVASFFILVFEWLADLLRLILSWL